MTQAQLAAAIKLLGASCKVFDGEIEVRFKGSSYFTNDREDALNTARAMTQEKGS